MSEKKRRRKSPKRVKLGKKLAKTLPRDTKGRFLPAGSKNLFRKRRRSKSSPAVPTRSRTKKTKTLAEAIRLGIVKKPRRRPNTMARKGKGRSFTRDFFPNFLSGKLEIAAAVGFAFNTVNVFTPIPRLKTIGNRATVMELLWVEFYVAPTFGILKNAAEEFIIQLSIGQPPGSSPLEPNSPRVFAHVVKAVEAVETANGTGMAILSLPMVFNFQEKGGFGYLLASDSFNFTASIAPQAANHIFAFKMYYRFVEIPLVEFIGLVQSTQQV